MAYADSKGADQAAHLRKLISAFVIRYLDSIITIVGISKLPRLLTASESEHSRLSLTGSHTSTGRFSHDVAHFFKKSRNLFSQDIKI